MMHKRLYLTCPTDHLETTIHSSFDGHKYFHTSLGCGHITDEDTIRQLALLIEEKGIQEILFVLAEDNRFILDGLDKQEFLGVSGINDLYDNILSKKKHVMHNWQMPYQYTILLSYYLNEKIKRLEMRLQEMIRFQPQINGKLYSKEYDSFRDIYAPLFCIDPVHFN